MSTSMNAARLLEMSAQTVFCWTLMTEQGPVWQFELSDEV